MIEDIEILIFVDCEVVECKKEINSLGDIGIFLIGDIEKEIIIITLDDRCIFFIS